MAVECEDRHGRAEAGLRLVRGRVASSSTCRWVGAEQPLRLNLATARPATCHTVERTSSGSLAAHLALLCLLVSGHVSPAFALPVSSLHQDASSSTASSEAVSLTSTSATISSTNAISATSQRKVQIVTGINPFMIKGMVKQFSLDSTPEPAPSSSAEPSDPSQPSVRPYNPRPRAKQSFDQRDLEVVDDGEAGLTSDPPTAVHHRQLVDLRRHERCGTRKRRVSLTLCGTTRSYNTAACQGSCSSSIGLRAVAAGEKPSHRSFIAERECRCCKPTETKEVEYSMLCADGTRDWVVVPQALKCACTVCGS